MTKRLLFGVTAPVSARAFLVGQLRHYVEQGWEVHLLCGEEGLENFADQERLDGIHVVPATRNPSLSDPKLLWGLIRLIRSIRPDATIMMTPKMGVLGTLAACLCRVPVRIYHIQGYRAEGLSGIARRIMVAMERLASRSSTHVVSVSHSLRQILIQERVCAPTKVRVLGEGSVTGVDTMRFSPPGDEERLAARKQLDIRLDADVIVFAGRLTRDKGIRDLPGIWESVVLSCPDAVLLVAGAPEPVDEDDETAIFTLGAMEGVQMLGHVDAFEDVLKAADVMLFLSRREGMGQVILEAASTGVPTVAFRASGVVDAISDGNTGLLHDLGDLHGISRSLTKLLVQDSHREHMGLSARKQVLDSYSREQVWSEWDRFLVSTVLDQRT